MRCWNTIWSAYFHCICIRWEKYFGNGVIQTYLCLWVFIVCEPEHIVSRWHVHGGNLCKIQLCCDANLCDSGAIGQYHAVISMLDTIFFGHGFFYSFLSAALLIFVIVYQSILSVFVVVTMSYFHRKITQTHNNNNISHRIFDKIMMIMESVTILADTFSRYRPLYPHFLRALSFFRTQTSGKYCKSTSIIRFYFIYANWYLKIEWKIEHP